MAQSLDPVNAFCSLVKKIFLSGSPHPDDQLTFSCMPHFQRQQVVLSIGDRHYGVSFFHIEQAASHDGLESLALHALRQVQAKIMGASPELPVTLSDVDRQRVATICTFIDDVFGRASEKIMKAAIAFHKEELDRLYPGFPLSQHARDCSILKHLVTAAKNHYDLLKEEAKCQKK